MDCCAYCTADSYDIKGLYKTLRGRYQTTMYREAVHIVIPDDEAPKDVFIFPYGSTVFWGMSLEERPDLLDEIKEFAYKPLDEVETDELTFSYGDKVHIKDDHITLPNKETLTKLAISHGIAQSVKLGAFEESITKTYDETKHIPEDLARRGKISLSRRQIRRKMGQLFIERNSINLHADILDIPEFFWEYPELEALYVLIANELDIETRAQVLNQRLDVVHELFQMLGNELNHQHSSRLEWTIIWLIVIEVVISLLRDVLEVI